jgi:hypothetical protein
MLLVTVLCYLGFTALCLSMGKHYGELLHGKLSTRRSRLLKVFGWACLSLSLWAALEATAVGMALVQWFAALMACALLLVFLIPFRPKWVLMLAAAGLLAGPVVAVNQWLA